MKYLVLMLVVLAVLWLARSNRRQDLPRKPPDPKQNALAREDMVACAQCGMHLPRSEALPGRGGLFCGEPHRTLFERENATP